MLSATLALKIRWEISSLNKWGKRDAWECAPAAPLSFRRPLWHFIFHFTLVRVIYWFYNIKKVYIRNEIYLRIMKIMTATNVSYWGEMYQVPACEFLNSISSLLRVRYPSSPPHPSVKFAHVLLKLWPFSVIFYVRFLLVEENVDR